VSDGDNYGVMKWEKGSKEGIVVTGGNGYGSKLSQLNGPRGVIVDQLGTVYVADYQNDRIMRWPKGSKQGSVIVGGQSNELNGPFGLSFDRHGNLYVADAGNHRVQKFEIE
jgi:DNA-binding beta-propeller fold protein YncE